ncbi:hypothetical protein ACS0TY_000660 [Phlomoides rotata]
MKFVISYYVFLVAIFQSSLISAKNCFPTNSFHVHIVNRIPNLDVLHCFSGDDNLGYHRPLQNQDYTFGFCDNIIHTTLFVCEAIRKFQYVSFDAFRSSDRHQCRYGLCNWEIREDGIYFQNQFGHSTDFQKRADWQNHGLAERNN